MGDLGSGALFLDGLKSESQGGRMEERYSVGNGSHTGDAQHQQTNKTNAAANHRESRSCSSLRVVVLRLHLCAMPRDDIRCDQSF